MKKIRKYFIKLILLVLLAIVLTHYFENIETKILVSIRNYFITGYADKYNEKNFGTMYVFSNELKINPVHVSQSVEKLANIILDYHKSNDYISLNSFIKNHDVDRIIKAADFLVSISSRSSSNNVEYLALPYQFDYPLYGGTIRAPWYSGMAQGLAIETFLAAYILTKNTNYLQLAKLAANFMMIPHADGGVAIYLNDKENSIWFEEYAHKDIKPSYALNGHIFAIYGLERLVQFDNSYNDLLNSAVYATANMLPKFSTIAYSRYDLVANMANPGYHQLHIDQMRHLKARYINYEFEKYYKIFIIQKYVPLGVFYRLLFYAHKSLLIVTMLNIAIVFFVFLVSVAERKCSKSGCLKSKCK